MADSPARLPACGLGAKMRPMNSSLPKLFLLLAALALCSTVCAETPASSPNEKNGGAQLETLIKKIDEQNMKIDALSQQILKLEQQITSIRPGVMIGEATPPPAPASAAASPVTPQSGNAHVVAKGETLTSIAKAHKVGVGELQKFNHIENDRALQIGQTLMIPTPGATPAPSSPAASPAASPAP